MAFNGWSKGAEFNGIVHTTENFRIGVNNRNEDHYGIIESNNIDSYISHFRKSDGNGAILGIRYRNGQVGFAKDMAYLKTNESGNWSDASILYGEHNWGAGLSGWGGVDNNATTNTQYAGYYKFASFRQRPSDWSRTTAMFFILGEDNQYFPTFLYISSRFNAMNQESLMSIPVWMNSFGPGIDTNLVSRIYICANKPTSNSVNTNVDLYWHQDSAYNSIRYYLMWGSVRGGQNKMDVHHYIDLFSPATPTLTNLSSKYAYVWKLSDNLNKILVIPK